MPASHEPAVAIFRLLYQPEAWAVNYLPRTEHKVRVRGQVHTKTKRFSVHAVDVAPTLPQAKGRNPYALMMETLAEAIKLKYGVERVTGLTIGKLGFDDQLR